MHRFIKSGRHAVASIALLVLLFAASGAARAANSHTTLRYVAVGVSRTPKLPAAQQLRFAHKDAQDLDRVWRSQQGKLCPQVEGITLINEQATRREIVAALDRLIATARPGDIAMISLCGHAGCCGVRGEWGFLPSDYDDGDAPNTALSATSLRTRLTELARRGVTVVLILDCCPAGAFGQASPDFVVFAACLPQEYSREDADWNNGLFTMAFIEALMGKADANGDGVVTVAEADAYVTSRVRQILRDRTALLGGIAESQNPCCGRPAGIRSSLPLARLAPPAAPLQQAQQAGVSR
jgi:Caspase domain